MMRKDLLALCGRLGLIVAVFAFIAGIVAGPLVQKVWNPQITVSEQDSGPALQPLQAPVELVADKQG